VTTWAENTLKSWSFGVLNPEGLSSLRLNIGFLGVGHMGPSKLSQAKAIFLITKLLRTWPWRPNFTGRSLKEISSPDRHGHIDAILPIPTFVEFYIPRHLEG
jgi:hypothetical protein